MNGAEQPGFAPIPLEGGDLGTYGDDLTHEHLGTLIEKRFGTPLLLSLVVVIGVLSNVGQTIWAGPQFGGMSGVVYGLFGFVWMKGKFDPTAGFAIPQQTVVIMIGWLFLCMTGALGPIGNACHAVGLLVGAAWGFASAKGLAFRA